MAIDDRVSSSSSKEGKEMSNQGEADRYTSRDLVSEVNSFYED